MAKAKICSVEGCDNPVRTRGLCNAHYLKEWKYGSPLAGRAPKPAPRLCPVDGCDKFVKTGGYCSAHYKRWWRHGDPLAGNAPHGAALAWLKKYSQYEGDDCLTWPFAKSPRGYGVLRTHPKQNSLTTASRAMCELAHGAPPHKWYWAAHICGCGHEGCVNPRHLRWATPASNNSDKIIHGTINRGTRVPFAKLTEDNVRRIRELAGTASYAALGRQFGVSGGAIARIINRIDWAWLE